MYLSKVILTNFRNFEDKSLQFSPETSVIVGPNASGKTNIIESIYLLSTGKSFRARLEEEMIDYSSDISRIKGLVNIKSTQRGNNLMAGGNRKIVTNLEVVLTRGTINISDSKFEKVPRKKLLIDGIGKKLVSFAGNFRVTLFGPWDLDLVIGSPSLRRNFLDSVLSQVDREYRRASLSYEKGLRQRNKLLLRIREEGVSRSQLLFWDKLLIKNGDYISKKREEFIEFVNTNKQLLTTNYQLEYDKSAISEERLEQYADEEVAAASTLVGPHRDDFIFMEINDKSKEKRELSRYGSRGEQRMGVLWLKLAELSFIESKTREKPTLLLDDIFSELDHEHREIVFEVSKGQQTIITTADPHYIEKLKGVEKIELSL